MTNENNNNPVKPVNKSSLDNAQSDVANQAMDGIQRTDINQDKVTANNSTGSDESLLDMLHDSKKID